MSDAAAGCPFCAILAGRLPATVLHRDPDVAAIVDINPQAPVHVLVMPVRHIESAAVVGAGDGALWARLHEVARQVARERGLDAGWRLVVNVDRDGGQTVGHLHMHLLGGRRMTWPPG